MHCFSNIFFKWVYKDREGGLVHHGVGVQSFHGARGQSYSHINSLARRARSHETLETRTPELSVNGVIYGKLALRNTDL